MCITLVHALLCESIRALIFPSRMSCISSSSSAETVVLNASAIFRMSADRYGLKYCKSHSNQCTVPSEQTQECYKSEAPTNQTIFMARFYKIK